MDRVGSAAAGRGQLPNAFLCESKPPDMNTPTVPDMRDGFVHEGLFYDSDAEYRAAVLGFVRDGLAAGQPVLVAVPGAKVELLRDGLGGDASRVRFADMTDLGRNPARIIPTVRDFVDAHPRRRIRFVGEPIWSTRSAAETREATRHEALINLAFSDTAATILCPYDVSRLSDAVLADAECTHSTVTHRGMRRASRPATDPADLPPGCDQPLPAPPDDVDVLAFRTTEDLTRIRSFISDHAARAGLPGERVEELVLATSELTANTLRHTEGGGAVLAWRAGDRLLCQVQDSGRLADPLADRRLPAPRVADRRGLWLVNQLCDLVELRSHETGTTVRLHIQLEGRSTP